MRSQKYGRHFERMTVLLMLFEDTKKTQATLKCSMGLLKNVGAGLFGRRLDVGLFEAEAFGFVHLLEDDAKDECSYAEGGEHEQGIGVVVGSGCLFGTHGAVFHSGYEFGIALVEHLADEHGEEPESDVLDPEDECVGRTDDFCINELGH